MIIYSNLKLQLWKCGLRQNQLAQLVNVDDTLLSKVVNGARKPSPHLRAEIARILECDEAWLFQEFTRTERPTAARGIAEGAR